MLPWALSPAGFIYTTGFNPAIPLWSHRAVCFSALKLFLAGLSPIPAPFFRSLTCSFPHSILHLSAGCPPASPLSAQEPNSPQVLHLILAKRPRSNSAQRLKHDRTWERLCGQMLGLLTAPEHPRAQDTGDAPLHFAPTDPSNLHPLKFPYRACTRDSCPAQPWSHPRIITAHPPVCQVGAPPLT